MRHILSLVLAVTAVLLFPAVILALDTDGDGLDDSVETNTGIYISPSDTGTNPSNPDTDSDGQNDGREVNWGSNPLEPAIVPTCCSQFGAEIRLTNDTGDSIYPKVIWNPDTQEYAVVWADDRAGNHEIYFARIDVNGNKIAPGDLRITNAQYESNVPDIEWTGSEYGVVWQDYRDDGDGICDTGSGTMDCQLEVYFARLDAFGNKLSGDIRIINAVGSSGWPSLAWTGTEYGLAWHDTRDANNGPEIYFAILSSNGTKLAGDFRITNIGGWSWYPSLTWSGAQYGLSYQDNKTGNERVYFIRLDSNGAIIGSELEVTNGYYGTGPSIVWNGFNYGLAFTDQFGGGRNVSYVGIGLDGAELAPETIITDPASRALNNRVQTVWSGEEYGIVWMDNRNLNYEIYFAQVNNSGSRIGSEYRITNDPASSDSPSLAWSGKEYVLAWVDNRDGNNEIYILRNAWDEDGDGISKFEEQNLYLTNPNDWDHDDDLLSDGQEVSIYGTDPKLPDTDFDDFTDGAEVSAGTSPLDPASTPAGSVNTLVGSGVSVTWGNVTVTFPQVTSAGNTTVTTSATGPIAPNGYRLGNPPVYFDISTTASYVGPVEVCVNYTGIEYGSYSSLKLFHRTTGWFNITTTLDTVGEVVCGETNSFSPFVVLEPLEPSLVPTLSEYGMMILAALLMFALVFQLKARGFAGRSIED